ncbi:DUF11 domain-containing protein [Microbispora sp. H10670]|uniref:DUF11 domain-containing protein n=1 Tax=Microbispora sp. H10670 TaxID=2729108 RepID=UPI001603895A|nr:DUF11 domain-containing protein [Microbispora sp. H10670]
MISRISAVAVLLLGMLAMNLAGGTARAAGTRPFSVTITHVECVDDCDEEGLEAALEGHADFYAKVWINGVKQPPGSSDDDPSTPIIDNNGSIDPFWVVSTQVPDSVVNVPVTIQIWDRDDSSGDDLGDASPRDDDNNLDFRVSYYNGKWIDHTGQEDQVNWPQSCSTGDGGDDDEPRVKVCFDVSTESTSGDSDGDFLLDGWERNGYNADGDGTVDVDLPGMGADPLRKDLFLEVDCLAAADHDHCPAQGAVQSVVQAFADAPVDNADGTKGLQLHVDVGNMFRQAPGTATTVPRAGAAAPVGTFGNYGGGGDRIAEAGNTVVDWDGAAGRPATNFFTLKNMNKARDLLFRYALFVHQTNYRSAANDCTSGWAKGIPGVNFIVALGGTNAGGGACWGTDAGGRSVGTQNEQAGTLMHEFGHTLGLQHGGGDSVNNKPNYLSLMNYTFQDCSVPAFPGVVPGGCDYSRVALSPLNEVLPPGLDECAGIGVAGAGGNDWDGGGLSGATCGPPLPTANVSANINGDFNDANGNGTQDPGEAAILGTLNGSEDWNRIFYGFRTIDGFPTAGRPTEGEPDPDAVRDNRAFLAPLVRPEPAVDTTGPAGANPGDTVGYDAKVANTGRGPALSTELTDVRPDGTRAVFDIGLLPVGAGATRHVSVEVPCTAEDGTVLTNRASATAKDMLGNAFSGSGTVTTTVHAPVLAVSKTATPSVNAGEAITYRITYENTGSGGADDVVVTDVLPAGVYYSRALDKGAGPAPEVTLNGDGTRTLVWHVGGVAGASGRRTIEYTARPSLLAAPGSTVTNTARVTFTNANGCTYAPVTASATTRITQVPATRDPLSQGYWKNHSQQWTDEILARIQATDQRFERADGSTADGALSPAEVTAVLTAGGPQVNILRTQLLAGYFNLATRRVDADTTVSSAAALRNGVHTVRDAALFAAGTLALPVAGNGDRYGDAIRILDEINNNRSEVY